MTREKRTQSILTAFMIGVCFHFAQLSKNGFNGDTLAFGHWYSTYLGELAQGRWGLLLFSNRVVNATAEFMGALMVWAAASVFLVEICEIHSKICILLAQGIFMSAPHISTYASFEYATFPYALAGFLAITSVYLLQKSYSLKRRRIWGYHAAAVGCLALSFGIWQGYLATYVTVLFLAILFADDWERRKALLRSAIVTAVLGTGLYVVIGNCETREACSQS